MKGTLAAGALALATLPAGALARDVQGWGTLAVTAPLDDGWQLGGELSLREAANERESQMLLRLQAGREVSDGLVLWLGYVRQKTFNPDARDGLEQRATGEANWAVGRLGPFRVNSRTRLEARFIRGTEGTSWRLREQLRLLYGIGKVDVAAGVEPFVALNQTVTARRTFEQLRLTGNVLVPLAKGAVLDIGYTHQRLYRPGTQVVNHVVPVVLRLTL